MCYLTYYEQANYIHFLMWQKDVSYVELFFGRLIFIICFHSQFLTCIHTHTQTHSQSFWSRSDVFVPFFFKFEWLIFFSAHGTHVHPLVSVILWKFNNFVLFQNSKAFSRPGTEKVSYSHYDLSVFSLSVFSYSFWDKCSFSILLRSFKSPALDYIWF